MRENDRPRTEPRWLGPVAPMRIALIPPISAARWLLILIVFAGIYFFHGFVIPVLAALVIGFASWPLYRDLLRRVGGNTTIGATIAIICVLSFIIIPISIALTYAIGELRDWIGWALQINRVGCAATMDRGAAGRW